MPQQSEFERLFLLEFFVDHVNIQNSSFDNRQSTLCVSFQFLHYPVMRVCEEDFTPPSMAPVTKVSKIVFKSGKSCLFSVHPDQNNKIPSQFNLVISVCQKSKFRDPPEKTLIGEAVVGLGNSFLNLLQPTNLSAPTTGVKHDVFPLKDKKGKTIGSLAAFARLSCFGKLIVTEIQLGAEENKHYLFKGTNPERMFKDEGDMPIIEREPPEEDIPKDMPYDEIFGYPKESEHEYICEEPGTDEEGEGDEKEIRTEDLEKKPTDEITDDKCKEGEEENFKEIGAEVNGNFIIIRVLKKRKRQKSSDDLCNDMAQLMACCCPPEPPVCPFAPKLNVCSCDYPLPPELVPKCPPLCCQIPPNCPPPRILSPKPDSNKVGLDTNQTPISVCPKENCPMNLNKNQSSSQAEVEGNTVAMKGDQVFFQPSNKPGEPMSEKEKKIASSLYYKENCKQSPNESSQNTEAINNIDSSDKTKMLNTTITNCSGNGNSKRSFDRKKKK